MGTPAAAAYLGMVPRTLYRLIDHGAVPAYHLGRVIRLRKSDLDALLATFRLKPGTLAHLYARTDDPLSGRYTATFDRKSGLTLTLGGADGTPLAAGEEDVVLCLDDVGTSTSRSYTGRFVADSDGSHEYHFEGSECAATSPEPKARRARSRKR